MPVSLKSTPQLHALHPANKNILPLDGTLAPYQNDQEAPVNDVTDFDLMQIVAEIQEDESGDNDLLLVATQYENSVRTETKTTMMAKKRMSPRKLNHAFSGYTFGSVGTIKIHIHKH